ncbi:MAG TPA: hypothetical protein VE971_02875 [Candidatus Eisenbacteria bacterium]|nr:hypothetical protein [Candidatus Eisenbacteria bacterium]
MRVEQEGAKERIVALIKKYLDSSKGVALKTRSRMTITGLFILVVAATLLNIQQSSLALATREESKMNIRSGNIVLTKGIFIDSKMLLDIDRLRCKSQKIE